MYKFQSNTRWCRLYIKSAKTRVCHKLPRDATLSRFRRTERFVKSTDTTRSIQKAENMLSTTSSVALVFLASLCLLNIGGTVAFPITQFEFMLAKVDNILHMANNLSVDYVSILYGTSTFLFITKQVQRMQSIVPMWNIGVFMI